MYPNPLTDTTPPVISQVANLCTTGGNVSKTVDRLTPPNFALPTVTDNSGATQNGGINLQLDSLTDLQGLQIAIKTRTTFTYRASDFQGNTATCNIIVDVKGLHI